MKTRCGVCQSGSGLPLVICTECVSPRQVRTFCRRCRTRLSLTVAEAAQVMGYLGINFQISLGTVIVLLHRCPLCRSTEEPSHFPQRLFAIDA